jgi:GTPase SAR1 family protein
MAADTAFFRITVLGKQKCGKTALINAWVNHYAPAVHIPTDFPALYYKAVSLAEGEDGEDVFQALVEIEDTYASDRGDGFIYDKDGKQEDRNISVFLDMGRTNTMSDATRKKINLGETVSSAPLEVYDAPKVNKYKPLTKSRMGFMFVFDAHDKESYKEALSLHKMLKDDLDKKKVRLNPVQFLVANQGDKNPSDETYKQIIEAAKVYSEEKMINLMEVSAMEFGFGDGIEKLFLNMVKTIKQNQILWMMDETPVGAAGVSDADALAKGCTIA